MSQKMKLPCNKAGAGTIHYPALDGYSSWVSSDSACQAAQALTMLQGLIVRL
jgi:hypothetical protein